MGLFRKRPSPEMAGLTPRLPRYGLLLVDDELFNLTTLAALLEDEYMVLTASTGGEALRLLADPAIARQVQVVISDQRMPAMSGVELLALVRARHPTIKRILLTGYTDVDAIIGAINEAAIYKYLRKPVDSQELRLTLSRALESWQLEQDHLTLLHDLQQALERLALLDADKLEFLRYLDHEMRTPLNWVGAAQVLDRQQFSPEQRELLGFIDQGQARLRALVTAVLRYFQVAALVAPQPATAQVDLPVLLHELGASYRRHFPEVELRLELPTTLTIACHGGLLREALDHLLENAFTHASHAEQPEVVVRLLQVLGQLELTVHNSGTGLGEPLLDQLFRPFRYGSEHGEQGFGISLATARAISLALGGDLMAHSVGGSAGVAMLLRLPLGGAAPQAAIKDGSDTLPADRAE